MSGLEELIAIVVIFLVIWIVLKMARVAIRIIFFVLGLVVIVGVFYFIFVR